MSPILRRAFIPILVLATTALLALGIFSPCFILNPGFGDYSPLVRLLKPDLTHPSQYSLFDGITQLAWGGNAYLAILLFVFSVVFPAAKLTVYWIAALDSPRHPRFAKTVIIAHHLGKFSMVDVFVIALIVIAIKGLPGGTRVDLQWGFWCFCAAIILSLMLPVILERWPRRLTAVSDAAPRKTSQSSST